MRPLPTLGGDFGEAIYLNEFGNIIGRITNARGRLRATLWTPTPGPVLVESPEQWDEAETPVSGGTRKDARAAVCAAASKAGAGSRYAIVAGRACLTR